MAVAELDPRLNAFRDDLAAAGLRERVTAPRYVEGEDRQVVAASAPIRRAPRADAPLDTEALHGELVTVYDENEGWAWCQLRRDGYVGYAPADAFSAAVRIVTHRVTALRTYVYPAPDTKTPPLRLLSLAAGLTVADRYERFVVLADSGFVFAAHVAPWGETAPDFVAVAERFLGTPYLWGGRTSVGLDCSALVQLSLGAAGIDAPRDTDMQQAAIGEARDPADLESLRRGDLLFWPGHVGIMCDTARLLHANAHHMQTETESVAEAVFRTAAADAPVSAIKRPEALGAP